MKLIPFAYLLNYKFILPEDLNTKPRTEKDVLLPLYTDEQIITLCSGNKKEIIEDNPKMNKRAIYKLKIETWKEEPIQGLFIADKKDIKNLIENKKPLCFYNSEKSSGKVFCILEKKNIKLVSDDEDFIDKFEKNDMTIGFNPLNYVLK